MKLTNNKPHWTTATLAVALLAAASVSPVSAQLFLDGTSYFEDFDGITNGLPDGWTVRTGASPSELGMVVPFNPEPVAWGVTSGRFANSASVTDNDGNPFTGEENAEAQAASLNRAPGVRQVAPGNQNFPNSDPGAAFVLRIGNTTGMGNFELELDFLMLNVQPRTTVWTVDYGLGNFPAAFTPVGAFTADSETFGATPGTFSFGNALDNQSENVWIRIVALTSSTGSGARDTFGIDNVLLAWTDADTTPVPPEITSQPESRTALLGGSATLSVSVTGAAPFTFQWKKDGQDVYDWDNISGASTATLNISPVREEDAGVYRVVISNPVDMVESEPATLTVEVPVPVETDIAHLRTLLDPVDYTPTDTETLFTTEGIVTTHANITTDSHALFYIQDDTAGIAVFVSEGNWIRPQAGDRVRVTGPLGHFRGLLQFNLLEANPTHSVETLSSGNPLPEPQPFNFSTQLDPAEMEASVEGKRVIVSNVSFPDAGGTFPAAENVTMIDGAGETFILRIDGRILDVIGQPIPEFAASIVGVMGQFDASAPFTGGYQLIITRWDDLVEGVAPPPSVALQISRVDGGIHVSWPASASGLLKMTEGLNPPNWQPAPEVPETVDGWNTVTIINPTGTRFYGLGPTAGSDSLFNGSVQRILMEASVLEMESRGIPLPPLPPLP